MRRWLSKDFQKHPRSVVDLALTEGLTSAFLTKSVKVLPQPVVYLDISTPTDNADCINLLLN